MEQLDQLIHDRKGADRLFASFKLGGIGISANVRVNLCLPSNDPNSPDHCEFAGDFFILGGPTEMPWTFFYPYLFDVTKSIHKFEGAHLDSNFYVTAEVQAVNGTSLPEGTLPDPVLIHKPSVGLVDGECTHERMNERTNQPTNQRTNQPANQPTNQAPNHPTTQPSNHPINQPTNQPKNQPTSQPTNQRTNQPTNQPTNQRTNQPANLPTNHRTTQPTSQPASQPTN